MNCHRTPVPPYLHTSSVSCGKDSKSFLCQQICGNIFRREATIAWVLTRKASLCDAKVQGYDNKALLYHSKA